MIGPPTSAGGGAPAARRRGGASNSHSQGSETGSKRKRGIFQKERQHMMYGFGDDASSFVVCAAPETVTLVEDIVEYVTDFDVGSMRGKLSVEDYLYLVRKGAPKLNRCKELLSMQEELKQARRAFNVEEEELAAPLD